MLLRLHCLFPLIIDLLVNGVRCKEPPHINMLRLSIADETTHRLRLTGCINLLRRGEQRGKENCMVGRRQIGSTCALIHDVQQKHPFFAVILEEFEVLALLVRSSPDLQEGDLMIREGLGNLLHEIWELHKDKDAIFF